MSVCGCPCPAPCFVSAWLCCMPFFPLRQFQTPQGIVQIIHYVLTWGCFLILAGALVGKQQGKIQIEQARLVKLNAEIGAANEKLQKARVETVLGMATLSEYRDHDTGLHLQRVSQLCRILADELRRTPPLDSYITDEYVEDLVLSSVLHDIGKVGVADSVLLKPGRLTAGGIRSCQGAYAGGRRCP